VQPRDPTEQFRSATPLELFFDLCFVVAVAQASSHLHHSLSEAHFAESLTSYLSVFFAIWWAWMNFTWFSSAYDTQDIPFRLATLVQIAGALVIAAGVPRAFDDKDFGVMTFGYVVMRLALVPLWLRVSTHSASHAMAIRYAIGISVLQVGWIALLLLDGTAQSIGFLVLVLGEVSVPVIAERHGTSPWHPRHIAERFGLFTLIVLGESVLAASLALQAAFDVGDALDEVVPIAIGAFLIVTAMWWIYFGLPTEAVVERANRVHQEGGYAAYAWGYGHLVVFTSAAAVGAGIAVAVDKATDHAAVTDAQAGLVVSIPVALFVASVWALHRRAKVKGWFRDFGVPLTAVVIVPCAFFPYSEIVIGVVLWALVVASIIAKADVVERDSQGAWG
jgi:low temperature requirement protein LtrA